MLPYTAPVEVIHHGVIRRGIDRLPEQNLIVVPGFINKWKGQLDILKALKGINNCKIMIVGKGHDKEYTQDLHDFVEDNKMDNVTIYDDYLPESNLFELFHSADFAILAHRRSTMSGILCHMISWRVPMILSNIAGFKEILGDNALYFDNTKELRNHTKTLLSSNYFKDKLVRGMAGLAATYSWESHADKLTNLYSRIGGTIK